MDDFLDFPVAVSMVHDHKFKIHPRHICAGGDFASLRASLFPQNSPSGLLLLRRRLSIYTPAAACYFLFFGRGASPYIVVYLTMLIIHEAWWCLLWCNWCLPGLCGAAASSPIHIPYVCVCFQQQQQNSLRAAPTNFCCAHTHSCTYTSCERRDSRGECISTSLGRKPATFPSLRTHTLWQTAWYFGAQSKTAHTHARHEIYATCQSFPLLQKTV